MTVPVKLKAREQNPAWPFIWFHGKIEDTISANSDEIQVDLIGSDAPVPTEEGITLVDVYGVDALCYVWKGRYGMTGLVVDPSDDHDVRYAISCYKNKKQNL